MKSIQYNGIYEWSDIIQMDFPVKRFIKEDGKTGLHLLASHNFHEFTYFEGVTFELIPLTNKFKAVENNHSKAKVWRFITIRNIEWEIKRVENYIWTLKFEFQSRDLISVEETRLDVLKCRLIEVLRGGVLV